MTLFWRAFILNAAVLILAVAVLALSPATVSDRPHVHEVIVLGVGAAIVLVLNLMVMRRVFGPLERLTAVMRRVDPSRPANACPSITPPPRSSSSPRRSTTCSSGSSASGATAGVARSTRRRMSA